jgi:hypothetical protein
MFNAVSNILKLHPVRVLQLAGHLPATVYSTPNALGEYVGTRFDALPVPLQDRLLSVLAELENEAGLENFGAIVRRFIPEAEALGKKRLTLVENLGLAIGHLTGISTEQLLLFALERLLTALFPGETFSDEQLARVARAALRESVHRSVPSAVPRFAHGQPHFGIAITALSVDPSGWHAETRTTGECSVDAS